MSNSATSCPKCGNTHVTHNDGADSSTLSHALHGITHGIKHGSPFFLVLGAANIAMRMLNPRKFTCHSCDHVFKA